MELSPVTPKEISQEINEILGAVGDELQRVLQIATAEYVFLSPEDREGLKQNFWKTHVSLMERETAETVQQVFLRFEELAEMQRRYNEEIFQTHTLPEAKRRGFAKGALSVMGL